MDAPSARLRAATRAIFEMCYPADSFERSESEGFPHYRQARRAASAVLEISMADIPERRYLTAFDVEFEIRFALGQAPAQLYVDARSRDRLKREAALHRLVGHVAARFAHSEVSHRLRPGWSGSPMAHVQVGPGFYSPLEEEPPMCNRARFDGEPETLRERFGATWLANAEASGELYPKAPAYVVRQDDRGRGIDVMRWDVLGGLAKRPMTAGGPPKPIAMTNVRQLGLPQWRALASDPAKRCLVPLTEFCEWAPKKDPEKGIKGEMWFGVTDQPVFAVAGFWQPLGEQSYFAMVTCDPNELVRPIHPKAMITILEEADWDRWLTGSYEDAVALQRPYAAERMTVRGPVFPTREAKA